MMLEVKIHLYERDMSYLSIAFFKWFVASIPPILFRCCFWNRK